MRGSGFGGPCAPSRSQNITPFNAGYPGSDRIGALDFQASPSDYIPRERDTASLEHLLNAAEHVDRGLPLKSDLAQALQDATAIGGARPKSLVRSGDRKYVAKFSSSSDTYSILEAEFIAMRLAAAAGLDVAGVELVRTMNKGCSSDKSASIGC